MPMKLQPNEFLWSWSLLDFDECLEGKLNDLSGSRRTGDT